MKDYKNNCEKRDAQTKRDNMLLNIACLLGTIGFIYALAIVHTIYEVTL